MLVYDDIYSWEGWGGALRIGHGHCRLRIFDLHRDDRKQIEHLRPVIAVITDVPESKTTIRNYGGHIATSVAHDFNLDPQRVLWIEYYPAIRYGVKGEKVIPERYDTVSFTWQRGKALHPQWRALKPPMLDSVRVLMASVGVS